MNRTIFSAFIAVFSAFMFSGCAPIFAFFGKNETLQISSPPPVILTAHYLKTDPFTGENISYPIGNDALGRYIFALSYYHNFTNSHIPNFVYDGGFKVESTKAGYALNYANGYTYYTLPGTQSTPTYYTKHSANAIFNIKTEVLSDTQMRFELLPTYELKQTRGALFDYVSPLDELPKLEADVKRIFASLDTIIISHTKKLAFDGEINNEFPAPSVRANFQRILGFFKSDDKKTKAQNNDTFAFTVANRTYPLKVEVYPYRNGSKVLYKTTLEYALTSDGKISLSPDDVEAAHKRIEAIVND